MAERERNKEAAPARLAHNSKEASAKGKNRFPTTWWSFGQRRHGESVGEAAIMAEGGSGSTADMAT